MKDNLTGLQARTNALRTPNASGWPYALGLFVLALLPRILSLGAIITPDERRWVERSVSFFTALLKGDWSHTFQTGHPGVTTMWTGTLGLWGKYLLGQGQGSLLDYLAQVTTRPSVTLEYLVPARLPTATLTALSVVLVYVLLRRLFDDTSALLGAALLALDPFYLAHSRVIHHDALATTFSVIAILTFLGYVWKGQNRWWLVLSGAATGLALLSKGSAMFLLPFMGVVWLSAIWVNVRSQPQRRAQVMRQYIVIGAIWLALTVIVFVVVWPAMWVNPIGTVSGMIEKAIGYAQEAHSKGNYFLGHPVEDPGVLFYPLTLLFRTTPLSLVGLVLLVVQLIQRVRRQGLADLVGDPHGRVQVSLLAYILLFTAFMTLGSKKFDRYLLSVFPIIDLLAGIALAQIVRQVLDTGRWRIQASRVTVVALIFMQGLASLPQHPYYLSAYNVLAGGPWLATQAVLVGWGEGLEQAAIYLNSKPGAENLKAATFYYRDIKTFFKGQGEKLEDDNPDNPVPWQGTDYVVFYINQVQRLIPDEATVRYFQSQTPEYTMGYNGIPYVQVYRTPVIVPDELLPGSHVQRMSFDGKLEHLSDTVDTSLVGSAGKLRVHLYWRALQRLETDYQLDLTLLDKAGHAWGAAAGALVSQEEPTSQWPVNRVLHSYSEIPVEKGAPTGEYTVQVGVSPLGSAQKIVLGPFPIEATKP